MSVFPIKCELCGGEFNGIHCLMNHKDFFGKVFCLDCSHMIEENERK